MSIRILEAIEHVISQWYPEISAVNKVFGPLETYSCQSVSEAHKRASQKLDADEYDELVGIAEFHVGRAILEASKFLKVVRTADIDLDMIQKEVSARAEVAFSGLGA